MARVWLLSSMVNEENYLFIRNFTMISPWRFKLVIPNPRLVQTVVSEETHLWSDNSLACSQGFQFFHSFQFSVLFLWKWMMIHFEENIMSKTFLPVIGFNLCSKFDPEICQDNTRCLSSNSWNRNIVMFQILVVHRIAFFVTSENKV